MRTFLTFTIFAIVLAVVAARVRPAVPVLYPTHMGLSSPPLSIEESLAGFRLADDRLRITCAAIQPMVEAPVTAQFDERGRLWVVEMRTYMPDVEATGEAQPANRISILEDTNHDGTFDRSTIFMDDLVLPRAVAPCFDGVLVIEPPHLLFCRDTDGDFRADERIILRDGLGGIESPEHAGNSLHFGIDGWYHISQHNEEFRIWMKDGVPQLEARKTPSHGQWGIAQDHLGRLYHTPNSNPLLVDLFPKHWGSLNPNMQGVSGLGISIAPGECWPIHATPGVNRGYQENTLRADKTLASVTAACGPTFLSTPRLGSEFEGSAIVCESAGNLVKRFTLKETDSGPRASQAYTKVEFLASTDERFRPVNTVEGPDGDLYILDMYRGVIQHKLFITNYLKDQMKARNLETPLNMGRIYRIAPQDQSPFALPDIGKLSTQQLIGLLEYTDSWRVMQATRLLYERLSLQPDPSVSQALQSVALRHDGLGAAAAVFLLAHVKPLQESDLALEWSPSARFALAQVMVNLPASQAKTQLLQRWAATPTEKILTPFIAAAFARDRDYPALLAFLSSHNDSVARSAALCHLRGQERKLFPLVLADPQLQTLRPFLFDLLACMLNATIQDRDQALSLIATAPEQLQKDLISRLASHLRLDSRSPRTLGLSAEPLAFLQLADSKDEALSQNVRRLSDRLTWPGRPIQVPPIRALTDAEQGRFDRGEFLYHNCVTCHQGDGRGAAGQAPPIAGSPYINGDADKLIRIILHGVQGSYEVNGQKYEGVMPVPPGVGSDADIAAVLTFVRRSFGNTADPIEPQTVDAVRKRYPKRYQAWTRQELDNSR